MQSINKQLLQHKDDAEPHICSKHTGIHTHTLFINLNVSRSTGTGTASELSVQKCHFVDSVQSRFQVSTTIIHPLIHFTTKCVWHIIHHSGCPSTAPHDIVLSRGRQNVSKSGMVQDNEGVEEKYWGYPTLRSDYGVWEVSYRIRYGAFFNIKSGCWWEPFIKCLKLSWKSGMEFNISSNSWTFLTVSAKYDSAPTV